jgi:hypothetical protein
MLLGGLLRFHGEPDPASIDLTGFPGMIYQ